MTCSLEDVMQTAMSFADATGEVLVVYRLDDSYGEGLHMMRTLERAMAEGAPPGGVEVGRAGYCDIKGPFWSTLQ